MHEVLEPMGFKDKSKQPTIRINGSDKEILDQICRDYGLSHTTALSLAIRSLDQELFERKVVEEDEELAKHPELLQQHNKDPFWDDLAEVERVYGPLKKLPQAD